MEISWIKTNLKKLGIVRVLNQFGFISLSNLVYNASGFLIGIIAARFLLPDAFGVVATLVAITQAFAILLDFGANTAMIRYYNYYYAIGNSESSNQTVGINLKCKLILGVLAIIVSPWLSPLLARWLFDDTQYGWQVQIALIAGSLVAFLEFLRSWTQSRRAFGQYASITLSDGILRVLAFLFFFVVLRQVSPEIVVFSSYIMPILLVLAAVGMLPPQRELLIRALRTATDLSLLRQLFAFSKWIVVSIVCVTLFQRLAPMMLASASSPAEVGLYSAAFNLAAGLGILNLSVRTLLLPKVSTFTRYAEVVSYIRLALMSTLFYILTWPVLFPISAYLFGWLYGPAYQSSLGTFLVLLGTFAVIPITSLFTVLVYPYNLQRFDALVNILRLSSFATLGAWLIPVYHSFGTAILYSAVMLTGEAALILAILRRVSQKTDLIESVQIKRISNRLALADNDQT